MKGNDWPGMIMLMGFVIIVTGTMTAAGHFFVGLLMIGYGFMILERDTDQKSV